MPFAYAASVITQSNEASKSITAVADGGSNELDLSVASHGYAAGDVVQVTGTTSYNGLYRVSSSVSAGVVAIPNTTIDGIVNTFGSTETGTIARGDKDLSGISGLTGVSTYTEDQITVWVIDSSTKLLISGGLNWNPESERLISNGVTSEIFDVNTTGYCIIGNIIGTNADGSNRYSRGVGLILAYNNTQFAAKSTSRGTLVFLGGEFWTSHVFDTASNGTIAATETRLVNNNESNPVQLLRSILIGDVTINDCIYDGIDYASVIFAQGGTGTFSADLAFGFFQTRGGTFTGPLSATGLVFAKNYSDRDIEINGRTNIDQAQPTEFTNVDAGTGLNVAYNASFFDGHLAIFQEVAITTLDASLTALPSTKIYIPTTNSGNRVNSVRTDYLNFQNGIDYTGSTYTSYAATTNGSGESGTITILLGRYWNDQTPVSEQRDFYSISQTAGTDNFNIRYMAYGYNLANLTLDIKSSSIKELEQVLITDTLITQTTKATVDAYTLLETAQKWYDRAKANLYDRFAGETSTDIGRAGNQADIGANNWILNATAASVYDYATKTIKVDTYTGGVTATSGTITLQNGVLLSGGTFDCTINIDSNSDGDTYTNLTATKIVHTGAGVVSLLLGGTSGSVGEIEVTGGATLTVYINNGAASPTKTETSGTITYVIPSGQIDFTGLVATSQVVVCNTGTTTEVFRTNSSSTTETTGSIPAGTYDYTVMKAGYFPIRVTGVVVSTTPIAAQIAQVEDRAYAASSGLTYGTTATLTTTTFAVTTATTVQNWYSAWIEFWIAQSALVNKKFPINPFGPNSFSLIDDYEFSAGSIQYLSRDGFRYINTSGTVTSKYCAILSQGVTAGLQARYQQLDGAAPINALNTGNVDQVIQFYGDATHGNFDYTSTLQFKVQANGYRQAEVDVISVYGNLEEQFYVIALTTIAIDGLTLGDPGITGVSLTDDSALPISWDAGDGAKNYSITITDTNSNTGEDILRWLNYNLAQVGTFQTKNTFDWGELVIDNGSAYETIRGTLHNGPDVIAGVRVIDGSGNPHEDFTRFQSDDGTYGTPIIYSDISVTGMPTAGADIRLQIINTTAVSASAWAGTTAYSLGDKVLRSTGTGSESTAGRYFVCTTAGTSGGLEPTWDTVVGNTTVDGTVTWTCYSILYYDANPSGASYASQYIDGEQFATGDTYEVRFAEMNGATSFKTFSISGSVSSTGFTVAVSAESDSVYATNAIDGSGATVTNKFTADYVNDEIDLDANLDFAVTEAYAYFCYELTSSSGMYIFWGGVTAIDAGNYRNNNDVVSIYFDETAGFVKQTDSARWFRSDGTRPVLDPTTGGCGLEINWKNPVYTVNVGGTALTPTESAKLLSLDTSNLDAAITTRPTLAEMNNLGVNIQQVNGYDVDGDGTESNPWNPV